MLLKNLLYSSLLLTLLSIMSCSKSSSPKPVSSHSNQIVLYWDQVAYDAFGGASYQHSLLASRINATMHLAIHDALNGIESKYARYAFTGNNDKADAIATASSAAHAVLLNEIPNRKGFIDSALANSLNTVKDGEAKTAGITLGQQAAQAILAKRANDGSAADPVGPIAPSDQPGVYQAVPPFNFIFATHWENVKLFSLERKDQFRCAPHPALNSPEYAAAFNEVKEFGRLNSGSRTPDQSFYANFWYEFSEAGWNRIARIVAASKKLDLLETARLFALVDMAMADAYIAGWDSKLHYNLWRPYTAIRRADIDGNSATTIDPSWEPALPTPPIQDYPSTHSALGNAATTVLAKLLGDNTPFTFASPTATPAGATRSFTGFSHAANENADSRVKAGIHFRFACDAGQELGNKIGKWTVDNHLRPLK